jgi:UDP-glucose 4-epimerase
VRTLVTGGAGFIGSHLVDALVRAGHDAVVVDDLSSGRVENLDWARQHGAQLVRQDVRDAAGMRQLLTSVRPEIVFHLAAQIDVSRAVADPLDDAMSNVVGTLAALEAARAGDVRRFVFASTGGAIYGDAALIPTPEHAVLAPLSPYGAAKAAAEQYISVYARLHGLSTLTLRMANVYGPRQAVRGEGGVIASYCRARLDGALAPVYGDGLQTRDYVHVRDVVAAFAAGAASEATGVLNVGTSTETTVLDLIAALRLVPDFRPARTGEVRRSCLDASAAHAVLGWRPRTLLADGLADTLAFAIAARAASPLPRRQRARRSVLDVPRLADQEGCS